MADPLSLLREFVSTGRIEEVVLSGDKVDFGGRFTFSKNAATGYKSQQVLVQGAIRGGNKQEQMCRVQPMPPFPGRAQPKAPPSPPSPPPTCSPFAKECDTFTLLLAGQGRLL